MDCWLGIIATRDCIIKISVSDYKGKRALILGLGISGLAVATFLQKRGVVVTGLDRAPKEVPFPVRTEKEIKLEEFDFVVVSPGIPPTDLMYREVIKSGIPYIGEAELALRECHIPILGITGTNGKTTTTRLVEHVLKFAGQKALALGNVGIPFSSEPECEVIVAEFSSFQLETFKTKCLDAACILNIAPDHFDRHKDMAEYAAAKFQIGRILKQNAPLFVPEELFSLFPEEIHKIDPKVIHTIHDEKVALFLEKMYRDRVSRELGNILAAFSLCKTRGVSLEAFAEALASFQKPPHRVQFVREIDGVRYYNDSKGTNPHAVEFAVASFEGPILLIAGGADKDLPFADWIPAFKEKVRAIYAIGRATDKLERELSAHFPFYRCGTLDVALREAKQGARPGETVLFSPGCTSLDQFQNYAHRGDTFMELCRKL